MAFRTMLHGGPGDGMTIDLDCSPDEAMPDVHVPHAPYGHRLSVYRYSREAKRCEYVEDQVMPEMPGLPDMPPVESEPEVDESLRALLLEAADRIEAITYGDCDDKSADDAAFAAKLRAAAGR